MAEKKNELKRRLLVVDDDARLRDLLLRYLGEQGFEVRAVPDAAGMDKQLSRERYDLLVLDLMLPGEDGLAICRRLRGQHMSPEERQRLREDMNAAKRDVYRDGQQRRDMPAPGGRMSPEEREKLRRDMMDANRGMPRR